MAFISVTGRFSNFDGTDLDGSVFFHADPVDQGGTRYAGGVRGEVVDGVLRPVELLSGVTYEVWFRLADRWGNRPQIASASFTASGDVSLTGLGDTVGVVVSGSSSGDGTATLSGSNIVSNGDGTATIQGV